MSKTVPLGEMIRFARIARRFTVRQLGDAIGCTGAQISNFEIGKAIPRVDEYKNIQAVLGYDFESDQAKAAFSFFFNGKAA